MRLTIATILFCITTFAQALDFKLPFSSTQNTFLNVNQAFQLSVAAPKNGIVKATWIVADGYYLYQHQFKLKGKDANALSFTQFSKGEAKHDEYFGDVTVYRNRFTAEIKYDKTLPQGTLIQASVGYQGCADKGLCYPPQLEPFEFIIPANSNTTNTNTQIKPPQQTEIPSPRTKTEDIRFSPSATSNVISLLEDDSWLTAALTLFGLGLLLSMTPCVLPMIPIVSAIVVGHKKTPLKAIYYSVLYVLSMALTYAFIGGIVGFFGLKLNIQAYLQDPIILGLSAILFIALALSMFGVYELKLPNFIQSKIQVNTSDNQSNKSIGVILSAIFATLVVSPCVSAPLAGVLLFISTQGEIAYGALMLFIMALGMGVPLLLVGIFGPAILPKSGDWLNDIKKIMGFGLIAVAIWLITRWISLDYHLYLWGTFLISIAAYFIHSILLGKSHPLRVFIIVITLLIGILYLVGGAMGSNNTLHPLLPPTYNKSTVNQETLNFAEITSLDQLNLFIQSNREKSIIMLDFYADWCINCKVIEQEIFYNEEVHSLLKELTLVRVNVTENDLGNQAIMDKFKVFGPPALIFLNANGDELHPFSLIGEPSLQEVRERLNFLKMEFSQ